MASLSYGLLITNTEATVPELRSFLRDSRRYGNIVPVVVWSYDGTIIQFNDEQERDIIIKRNDPKELNRLLLEAKSSL